MKQNMSRALKTHKISFKRARTNLNYWRMTKFQENRISGLLPGRHLDRAPDRFTLICFFFSEKDETNENKNKLQSLTRE